MKQHHDSFSSKTLVELEDSPVREPTETDTHLIQTCLRLMRVPLNQLTTGNLRMLIGQQIGLKFLVPLALGTLEQDPLAAADFYKGDLLHAVVSVPPAFWVAELGLRLRLDQIVMELKDRIRYLDCEVFPNYDRMYGA